MEKRKLGEVVNYKNGGSFESLVKNHGVYKLITLKSVNTEGKLCNSGKYIDDKCVETLCNDTFSNDTERASTRTSWNDCNYT